MKTDDKVTEAIKTPVTYGAYEVKDANNLVLFEMNLCLGNDCRPIAEQICNAINQHEALTNELLELRGRVHKSDGMANEVNILTKENRELREEVGKMQTKIALMRKNAPHSDEDFSYLCGSKYCRCCS